MPLDVISYLAARKTARKLEEHRTATPIDHPDNAITTPKIADLAVTRTKLEYPTEDVTLAYLAAIGKADVLTANGGHGLFLGTLDNFVDKRFDAVLAIGGTSGSDDYLKVCVGGRVAGHKRYNSYLAGFNTSAATADFGIQKCLAGVCTVLGTEAVDIIAGTDWLVAISIAGSTIKAYRADPDTPKITVTDTDLASGKYGGSATPSSDNESQTASILLGMLKAPSSPAPPALRVIEVDELAKELREVNGINVPDFIAREAKKYEMLKQKGFTDEEIEALLGYIPKHHIDVAAVTWGCFECRPGKPNIVMVTGGNPYTGWRAVERQIEHARRKGLTVLKPPKEYREAKEQYKQIARDHDFLAGKDNWAYQVLGHEEIELLAVADFYYGFLVEHRTRPQLDQLKRVPDWEMRRTINMWMKRLERVSALTEERDKHLQKLRKVEKLGW